MAEGKDLVAYCSLYCGDCYRYKGNIADLARDLRKELRQAKFALEAEALSEIPIFAILKNYPQCYEVLGLMVKLRCKITCQSGGGPPVCQIRDCCRKKEIDGCWQCDEFETCQKLDFLKLFHGNAYVIKNLKILKKAGVDSFIAGKRYW